MLSTPSSHGRRTLSLSQIPSAWREGPNRVMNARCAGFWRWKSRRRAGRPSVPPEIRRLIGEMSLANPLWGAPRIHGELLKLGIDIGQTSVAKYMARRRRPPSQGWRTFLLNHADGIASIDLFVVPTISFKLLYGLLILRNDRRRILWVGVTRSPTAEWIARQVSEACGWGTRPRLPRSRARWPRGVRVHQLAQNRPNAAQLSPSSSTGLKRGAFRKRGE